MKQEEEFYISKSSRRATLLLLILTLVIVFIPRMYNWLRPSESFEITAEIIKESKTLRENTFKVDSRSSAKKLSKYKRPSSKFDPNTYSKEEWMNLGLSEKQAAVVLKFTSRGVKSSSDIQKIFVIPEELFRLIVDSLEFSSGSHYERNFHQPNRATERKQIVVELNSATKDQLKELPGVGDYISDRILNYRERLGGFVRKEQLLEIKKIDLELYGKIEDLIRVDAKQVKIIPLNNAIAEDLKSHPYLNWNIANSIVKIRQQKGGEFKSIEEIMESVLIDRELFEKVKAYLSL